MSNEYKDWLMEEIEENRRLVKKYPFLIPFNYRHNMCEYTYEFTYANLIPYGWRTAFGEQMFDEILAVFDDDSAAMDVFCIADIKDKYGELRMYFFFDDYMEENEEILAKHKTYSEKIEEITDKYTKLSRDICINCGAAAANVRGYESLPLCEKCRNNIW